MEYSFGFDDDLQQEWEWSERYAPQPEILRYANHVADRFDLRRDIRFDTRVTAATYDEASGRWTVTTDQGPAVTARYVVMATGCLSTANIPEIAGAERFAGPTYHTGRWPHEGVDFTGLRVGVIGTG
jgi:cyclohexanone monooxygenase